MARESSDDFSSSYKDMNPIVGAPPSGPHLNSPKTITLGVRALTHGFGGGTETFGP